MAKIVIREAKLSDMQDVYDWRNDKHTRAMSISGEEIKLSAHERWFEGAISSSNTLMYIAQSQVDDTAIGVVRFDIEDSGEQATISINLAPFSRGKGYAKPSLKACLSTFIASHPECKIIKATIKRQNMSSRKSFEGLGFVRTDFEYESTEGNDREPLEYQLSLTSYFTELSSA